MKKLFFILSFEVIASNVLLGQANSEKNIPNGMYLILEEYSELPESPPDNFVVSYSRDFLDSNTTGQPLYLEIDTTEFVRFDLSEEPKGIEQPDQRINLMLTLSNSASDQLADFTEKHVNERVAIVIGNKAVTKHKVRTRIEGGKLQITRCTDNACKHLLMELRENYPK